MMNNYDETKVQTYFLDLFYTDGDTQIIDSIDTQCTSTQYSKYSY